MSIFNSKLGIEAVSSILKDVHGSVRFIGILGSGMRPLAELLVRLGQSVSGWDRLLEQGTVKQIEGVTLAPCYATRWQEVKLAVYSLAMDSEDTEITSAIAHGVPLVSRAELLGAVMSGFNRRISVSGSHGKSTTTALIEHILRECGSSPTAVSGATLTSDNSYAIGNTDIIVAEACEYKDSFLSLCPTHQIITSVELDHTDFFTSIEHIRLSFLAAAQRSQVAIINADDKVARSIADELEGSSVTYTGKVITYGKADDADYRLSCVSSSGGTTYFRIESGCRVFDLSTSLIGEYNLYNITAAVVLCDLLLVPRDMIAAAVCSFMGIDRRATRIALIDGVPVFYDYAHHPTEIGAFISALKERYGTVSVIFKPHTYTRTMSLWTEFIAELSKSDFTIILDIYPARESPVEGVTSENLAKMIKNAHYSKDMDACKTALTYPCGAIALLGAGDMSRVVEDFRKIQ